MQKRCHVFFTGTVQGVGFRYTAHMFARQYNIKGWVANIADGRVELEAEGSDYALNQFLASLQNEFRQGITKMQTEEYPSIAGYNDFRIKR
ncbi:MAG: acylphosphatase [Candidatus Omnitrophota bacterium]